MMGNMYEDGSYLEKNPRWHEEDSSWKALQIARLISRNNLYPSTICEVGCGAGEILNQLSQQLSEDIRYVGYEISPQAFEICQQRAGHNLSFVLDDLLDDDGSVLFDIVMAIDVFEHVEDYFGFLRGLKTKGEYKVFHIPLDLSVQGVLRASPLMTRRRLVGHIHHFTKETALATLEDTGYEILDLFYTAGSLELPGRGWRANLLRIPRKVFFGLHKDLCVRILGGYSLMVLAK